MSESRRDYGVLSTEAVCGVLILAIAALDTVTPQGVAEAVLYATVILAAFRSPSARVIVGFGVACTLLTAVGFYLSPGGGELWTSVANRGIAVLAIWTAVVIGLRWQRLARENLRLAAEREAALTRALEQFIPICAWCKKVRNERDEWGSLERYVAARTDSTFTHGICPECFREAGRDAAGPPPGGAPHPAGRNGSG